MVANSRNNYFDLLSRLITSFYQSSQENLKEKEKRLHRQQYIRWKSACAWGQVWKEASKGWTMSQLERHFWNFTITLM